MKTIFLLLLLFLFLRFVYRYILPIVRVVRNARKAMGQMQQGFNNNSGQPYSQPQQPLQQSAPTRAAKIEGDYIDYEEVK